MTSKVVPASAGGQGGGGDVADGGRLQSGGGRAGAHVEQLRLSRDVFGRPVEQTYWLYYLQFDYLLRNLRSQSAED